MSEDKNVTWRDLLTSTDVATFVEELDDPHITEIYESSQHILLVEEDTLNPEYQIAAEADDAISRQAAIRYGKVRARDLP